MSAKVNGHSPTGGVGNSLPLNGKPRLPPIHTPASILSSNNSRDYSKSKLMKHRRSTETQKLMQKIMCEKAQKTMEDVSESNRRRPPSAKNPEYPTSVSTCVFALLFAELKDVIPSRSVFLLIPSFEVLF